ncbi:hypothetical protein Mal48_46970 [Thalassoglobus polymorphus]|uniref:Uncharacterized protein n=1 Tax=Thalassoglobus polymorphus TaxID=2527994 RepID=A0A517QUX9_9PLAN|nr:hypothetical protein Mal48_46970 [Thalassoglobus polymorphus]
MQVRQGFIKQNRSHHQPSTENKGWEFSARFDLDCCHLVRAERHIEEVSSKAKPTIEVEERRRDDNASNGNCSNVNSISENSSQFG